MGLSPSIKSIRGYGVQYKHPGFLQPQSFIFCLAFVYDGDLHVQYGVVFRAVVCCYRVGIFSADASLMISQSFI